MNKKNLAMLGTVLALIAAGGVALSYFSTHQKLGAPAVKTQPLAGSKNVEVLLPAKVLNYDSVTVEVSEIETNTLPKDTSFGKRLYSAPDNFQILASVVLMGSDRTSLHKPQFCLTGQGWTVDQAATVKTKIHIERPYSYELPVVEMLSSREGTIQGEKAAIRGVYVYYYVAESALYAGTTGFGHMFRSACDVLTTGTQPRWAYVSYFTACPPGAETQTFDRIRQFIAATTPEFQLYTPPGSAAMTARN